MLQKEKIKDVKLFLFDMDGTLYLGDRLFDFTKELLFQIRQNRAEYLFMTNNSSKSVASYIKKLDGMGIAAEYDDFQSGLNAGCLTALVLSGETDEKMLAASDVKPDFVFSSGKEILDIIRE